MTHPSSHSSSRSLRRWALSRSALILAVATCGLTACRPCDTFDERMCDRLGPDDCVLWKGPLERAGSPSVHDGNSGSLRSKLRGRGIVENLLYGENGRMCANALDNFNAVADGIASAVGAQKRLEAAQQAAVVK